MSATDDPQGFFEEHAPDLQAAAARGPADAIAFIERFADDVEKRIMYLFARRALVMEEWPGRTLDTCIAVARAGIAEMLRQADNAPTPDMKARCVNLANAMSYDLAADTADCWPEDQLQRTRAHFEAGLKAAENCIRWRNELASGPDSLAMAWWAKGMHQISLGDPAGAAESFTLSVELAQQAARAAGRSDGVTLDGDFGVILGWGYLGIAQWMQGDPEGKTRYDEAISTFNAQCADPELEEDARYGIDQLEAVRAKYTERV